MTTFRCPNCQCEVSLTEARAKRLAAGVAWFCLGGFLAAVAAGDTLPHVGASPPDADWVAQVRESHKDDPGQAEELIRQRQADDEQDWLRRMSPVERGVFETKALVQTAGILSLCMGIPAAVLAFSIKSDAVQKRPPRKTD